MKIGFFEIKQQHPNHQGSCTLETDDIGRVITYEEYHPFGTTSYQATNAAITASYKRYRYTGMERDEETGLSYHNARYYISWLGRWLNPDPIGINDGVNVYAYCGNNPVTHTDTSGTQMNKPQVTTGANGLPFINLNTTMSKIADAASLRAAGTEATSITPKEGISAAGSKPAAPFNTPGNPQTAMRSASGTAAGGTAAPMGNASYTKQTQGIQTSLATTAAFERQGMVAPGAVARQEKAIIEQEKKEGAGNFALFVLGVATAPLIELAAPYLAAEGSMIARFGLPAFKETLAGGGTSLLSRTLVNTFVPRYGLSPGGAVADIINQTVIQGKSINQYNPATTMSNLFFGGGSVFSNAIWGASGSFIDLSQDGIRNGEIFSITDEKVVSFKASFIGNLAGGGTSKIFENFGLKQTSNDLYERIMLNSLWHGLDGNNAFYGNLLSNHLEDEMTNKK